ncbi:MAG: hypothetical protein R3E79_17145 [Caldilineaceae bacterium]
MQDWLTARVQATPRKTALIIGEEQWNYGKLGANWSMPTAPV